MLTELVVRDLGVVSELRLVLGEGLTVFTGETGAGKTLIVEAVGLLAGGRAEGIKVRRGADEAVVEGRFSHGDEEVVLRRVIPAQGRSRSYVNGEMATVATLSEWGDRLVDQHAQHAHHGLLGVEAQRSALDRFGEVDLDRLNVLRSELAENARRMAALGGDQATRAREIDLLRFQLEELEAAQLTDPGEDERLAGEQETLADVAAHRLGAANALGALTDDGGAADAVGTAIAALEDRVPFDEAVGRLRSVAEEIVDIARDVRSTGESIVDDPGRLDLLRERRQLLHTLTRKFGDGTLQGVIDARDALVARLDELEGHDQTVVELAEARDRLLGAERAECAVVGARRRDAAPKLAALIEAELHRLAMDRARLLVVVGADPGEDVQFLLAANPGSPPLPLTKVASGGELARTMLALRLVLSSAPPTMVFDEVDAGIGGTAAAAVGEALARLGRNRQVLVVTHLPQVAAVAGTQFVVTKEQRSRSTTTTARRLDGEERVIELSRMLSGQPSSEAARAHARDLLSAESRGIEDD